MIENSPITMPRTLRDYRILNALTMEDMGVLLGIHPQTYAKYEKDPGSLTIEQAKVIAQRFGVTVNDIFFNPNI